MVQFKKAERKKAKLRLGISGASGAGKTYTSLLIAKGLVKDFSKVALIDTENGSGELYSNLGEYSVATIRPPFSPDKYIEAIRAAEQAGFEVIIIDSLSHAWTGEGGLLDIHDKATRASKSSNSYAAWREVTPKHNQLIDTLLQSLSHVIVTTRAKAEYVLQDDNGRKVPKKVGMSPIFRDGLEYEMTVFLEMSQDHIATATKDRTKLFDGKSFIPTPDTGAELLGWLEGGADVKVNPKDALKNIIRAGNEQSERIREILQTQYAGRQSSTLTADEAQQILDALSRGSQREQSNPTLYDKVPEPQGDGFLQKPGQNGGSA